MQRAQVTAGWEVSALRRETLSGRHRHTEEYGLILRTLLTAVLLQRPRIFTVPWKSTSRKEIFIYVSEESSSNGKG